MLCNSSIESQNGQHSAVHGHRDGHLAEVNLVEQYLHVEDAVDSHTSLADVADDALVVAVVAAVRGQVESTAQTLLTGGDIAAVEGVTLFSGRETGVLADSPGTHHIHSRVRSAQERRDTGGIVQVLHALEVFLAVGGLHVDLLRSPPVLLDMIFFFPFLERFTPFFRGANVHF